MTNLPRARRAFNPASMMAANLSAAERLTDQVRRRSIPWAARCLGRRADIRPHVAQITAEAMGLGERGR
jgi:hypothetical protein